jgi:hypothetical protein
MASSLAEIRAKLAAMEPKSGSESKNSQDNASYPFWNIEEGKTATLRFLPDGDQKNTFFWVERQMIRLTFPGVKGGENKPVTIQVPCMEMWGDTCPILTEVRPWYKDNDLKEMAGKYWKKRSYVFQGFVTENPLAEESPENPIRRFIIGPQVFNIIKSALMDPDMENIPTDYLNGTDFKLTKTSKGQYADYSTSKWARKESSLNEAQLSAIDQFGLNNLADFLPAKPSAEAVQAIAEMFQASVDGELYDPARWAQHYKPYGLDTGSTKTATDSAAAAPARTPAPVSAPVETDDIPFEPDPVQQPVQAGTTAAGTAGAGKSANDILNMIRSRTNA